MDRIEDLVENLGLVPHPEGGYYRETYRADGSFDLSNNTDYDGERNYATAIYFLLTEGNFSAWHRIKQDEVWHFYSGSPLAVHAISQEGEYSKTLLGQSTGKGEVFQYVVPGGHWFASESLGAFSLVGCTVSPGFDFKDFELAKREELQVLFPEHRRIIEDLTRI